MVTAATHPDITVRLRRPHPKQRAFIASEAPRKVIRAGRRSGKTTGLATLAVEKFLQSRRILYAAPTQDQVETFWWEVKRALVEPIDAGMYYKNETMRLIERPGTKQRIRAKTAFNADSLRGDFADLLILDEWQLMDEDAWESVGVPMLLDNNGDAVFLYTPPSLHSRSVTKARDPRHAAKMYQKALTDTTGRWAAFSFTSHDNPYISPTALSEIVVDMTASAYRQEILAEDTEDVPGALWKQTIIDACRVTAAPQLDRIIIGVDPPGGQTECGIVAAGIGKCECQGKGQRHLFIIADASLRASPDAWAWAAVNLYQTRRADRIVGEQNYGGDMVESTIRTAATARGVNHVSYQHVNATRGKAVRAEPIAAQYEQRKIHHVGTFLHLEDEMTRWVPGEGGRSPNRVDAMVWACTGLLGIGSGVGLFV